MRWRRLIAGLAIALLVPGCSLLRHGSSKTDFLPGKTYFGANDYIEYRAGSLPIILSAPHGGSLEPAAIPDRTWGTTVRDSNTEDLIRRAYTALYAVTGQYPHVVINRLRRTKLDANREIVEAAQGDPMAEQAWHDWHTFLEAASEEVTETYGAGIYIDLHGHGHDIQRLELGYRLTAADLAQEDAVLNQPAYVSKSSVRALIVQSGVAHSALLRGPSCFGTLMEGLGFPAVPSAAQPDPGSDPYFTGGYNTDRYGSSAGGMVSGFQIECNMIGVRDTPENRQAFAEALTAALLSYLEEHLGMDLTSARDR